jgi:hypothetical protein
MRIAVDGQSFPQGNLCGLDRALRIPMDAIAFAGVAVFGDRPGTEGA